MFLLSLLHYEIVNVNYICFRYKNRRKHKQHFKLLYFKISLLFGTSDEISSYGKLDLLSMNSMSLIFSSREMQRRLIQTKVCYNLFYSVSKEAFHKPLKVAAAKKSFPRVFVIDTTCFNEFLLFYVITGKTAFHTNLTLPRHLVPPLCYCFL